MIFRFFVLVNWMVVLFIERREIEGKIDFVFWGMGELGIFFGIF